jgi:hypothetical protein
MGNISSAFQDALAAQAKAALVEVVAANPKITVKDLAGLVADNPTLGSLSLNDLLGGAPAPAKPVARVGRRKAAPPPARKAASAAAPAASAAAAKGGEVKRNVRTEAGREAFEQEVLGAIRELGGNNIAAGQLRSLLNSEPTQLRAALNRLIERGILTFTGKARGTRYTLA